MELLLSEISKEIKLTAEEGKVVQASFTHKKIQKRHLLMQVGDIFRYIAFVEKGILRSYLPGIKEEEHVIQFAPEGSWIPDSFNLVADEVSRYNIDALENSEVWLIDRESFQELLQAIPRLEKYFRMVMQKRLDALHLRVINYLTHFAEDKYKMFVDVYPDIVQRAPQHMIASYLGIKPETLSRNRKKIATRKS